MKLTAKQKCILKSYLRGVLVACTPLLAMRATNLWDYAAAVAAGVIAPALRAIDKNDPAFGMIADAAADEVVAVTAKKATPKK